MDKSKKKPRGRPTVENPATERLEIRITPGQKTRYEKAAKKSGLAVGAWIKDLADKNS